MFLLNNIPLAHWDQRPGRKWFRTELVEQDPRNPLLLNNFHVIRKNCKWAFDFWYFIQVEEQRAPSCWHIIIMMWIAARGLSFTKTSGLNCFLVRKLMLFACSLLHCFVFHFFATNLLDVFWFPPICKQLTLMFSLGYVDFVFWRSICFRLINVFDACFRRHIFFRYIFNDCPSVAPSFTSSITVGEEARSNMYERNNIKKAAFVSAVGARMYV